VTFCAPGFAPVFWALTWAAVVAVAKRSHWHPEQSEGPAFASASRNPPSTRAALDLRHRESSKGKARLHRLRKKSVSYRGKSPVSYQGIALANRKSSKNQTPL